MTVRLATWNINSVRLREAAVLRLLREEAPGRALPPGDQDPGREVPARRPPRARLRSHVVARGEKGYNGVAILSRLPLEDVPHRDFCTRGDARHVAARLPSGAVVHNLYIPAGGDVPDPALNPKFAHKLDFLAELRAWFADTPPERAILVGDLNVAPREDDVWSHRQLLRIVSHTPVEVEAFTAAQSAGGWVDVTRAHHPRGPALLLVVLPRPRLAGRRQGPPPRPHLGHPRPRRALRRQPHRPPRARLGRRPSDHVPVFAEFEA